MLFRRGGNSIVIVPAPQTKPKKGLLDALASLIRTGVNENFPRVDWFLSGKRKLGEMLDPMMLCSSNHLDELAHMLTSSGWGEYAWRQIWVAHDAPVVLEVPEIAYRERTRYLRDRKQ